MASWDTAATQNVSQIIAGSGVTLSPPYGQGIVTISAAGGSGGVTSLIAGTNITLSPTNGLGNVTINASGGGGGGGFISTATSQLDMTSYPVLTSSITGLSSINGRAYPNWVSTATSRLDMTTYPIFVSTLNVTNNLNMNSSNVTNLNSIASINSSQQNSPLNYPFFGTGLTPGAIWGRMCSTPTGVFIGVQANKTTPGYIVRGGTIPAWTVVTGAGKLLWTGITSRSLTSAWACVYGGQIYRSTNNAVSFPVTVGSPSLNWTGICSSENDVLKCVACATGGGIYYTADGGTTWTITNASPSLAWGGIAMANDLTYVVAFTDTQVYYCTDGTGTTWNLVPGQPTLPVGSTWSDVALNSFSSNLFWITTSASVAYRVTISTSTWSVLTVPGTCVAMTPGYQAQGVVVGDALTGKLSYSYFAGAPYNAFTQTYTVTGGSWASVAVTTLVPTTTTPTGRQTNIAGGLTNGSAYSWVSGTINMSAGRNITITTGDILTTNANTASMTTAYGMSIINNVSSPITISNLYGQPINLQTNTLQYSSPASSNVYVRQPFIQWGTATGSGGSGTVVVTIPQAYTTSSSYVVQVTMMDAPTAELYATPTATTSFTIGWTSAGTGTQTIMWTTFGN